MTTTLAEILCETMPAKWTKGGGPRGDYRAYLDVYGCRVWVVCNPDTPSDAPVVSVAEDGMLPIRIGGHKSGYLNVIDAVVECVRRAVLAQRAIHAFDVPVWAHDRIRSGIMVPARDDGARARYDRLLAEIAALG